MEIKSHLRTHVFFWSAVSLLLVINIVLICGHLFFGPLHKWEENTLAGRVESVGGTRLVTVDPRGNANTFAISSSTKFILGKEEVSVDYLSPDIPVLVKVEGSDKFQAVEVRIMSDKPSRKLLK